MGLVRAAAGLWLAVCSWAQTVHSLRLYSEFQRVDPFGQILAVDRSSKPREILSPAVARNSFFSIHVAVTAAPKAMYFLALQSYPPGAFQWKIYRESFSNHSSGWIPDTLTEERPPYFELMPDTEVNIPGQTTQLYLVDVWVPPDTPSSSVRLEVLVKSDSWRIAPMEVRVLPVTVPALPQGQVVEPLPDVKLSADASAAKAMAAATSASPAPPPVNLRAIIYRNALQDAALARTLHPEAAERCRGASSKQDRLGAEGYLRVRDCLYRTAWKEPVRPQALK
ncbi:MAG TPA: hypothetical protein VM120_01810 [Bryobacteraceae bacterium]|nr:hypothetical protein [Bryobacteraceae bacterium]